MPTFKHILFPIDFSDQNCGIAASVACIARRYNARVTMLHVMEPPMGVYPGWPVNAATVHLQEMREERKQRLDSFLAPEFQGVSTTRVIAEGDPAHRIVQFAEQEKVDLIMMPTHGYGPFRRFLLGSVTAKVLHDVKCAVWTSAHSPQTPPVPSGYRMVLCAIDYSPESLQVLRWATLFACEQGATLKLVHAIPAASVPGALDAEDGKFRTFLFDMARTELAKLQHEAGTKHPVVIKGGDVAEVVRAAAEESQADLVVIGRGVMQELFGRMRTNLYTVVREAPCPVISA